MRSFDEFIFIFSIDVLIRFILLFVIGELLYGFQPFLFDTSQAVSLVNLLRIGLSFFPNFFITQSGVKCIYMHHTYYVHQFHSHMTIMSNLIRHLKSWEPTIFTEPRIWWSKINTTFTSQNIQQWTYLNFTLWSWSQFSIIRSNHHEQFRLHRITDTGWVGIEWIDDSHRLQSTSCKYWLSSSFT